MPWVYDPHSGGIKIPKAVQEWTRNRIWLMLRSITPANTRASRCDFAASFVTLMRIENPMFHVALTQNYTANHGRSILNGCEIRQPIWVACAISAMKIVGRWLFTLIAMRHTNRRFSTLAVTTVPPRRALRPVRCICEIEVNNVSRFGCSLVN